MFDNNDISKMVSQKYQRLVLDYVTFLKIGQSHFDNKKLQSTTRLDKLNLLEKALRKETPLSKSLIFRLQKAFIEENISISLLLEPLTAWRYFAADKYPTSEEQISEILNRLLSPVARLVLVLNNEHPTTYLPMTSLFVLLCMLEMPQTSDIFIKNAKISKRQQKSRLLGLYKSAFTLLSLIKNKSLKFKIALLLNKAHLHTLKLKNNKHWQFGFLDYLVIFAYSAFQFLFVKRKSVNIEGI